MSRVDDLIAELCPEGVEFEALGEVGRWYGGGTPAKHKAEYWEGGTIPWLSPKDMGQPVIGTTQDFITEAAVAGSATKMVPANSVAVVVRSSILDRVLPIALVSVPITLNQDMKAVIGGPDVLSGYLAHLLRSRGSELLASTRKTGGSVASIEVPRLMRFRIPVPPMEVQREIVRVLDTFTELEAALEAELEAELAARRRQYAHYRDSLLSFAERESVRWARLNEIGSLYNGLSGKSKVDFDGGNARFVTYVNVFNNLSTSTSPNDRVRVTDGERQNQVHCGDVLFTASSESVEDVGMSSAVTREPTEPLYLNSFCFGFRPREVTLIHPDFAKHLFRAESIRRQITRTANGVTRINISKDRFREIRVPLPDLAEQARIVGILDRFDALVNDLSVGLPAELAARRRQYEHYRDRLLTFREAA